MEIEILGQPVGAPAYRVTHARSDPMLEVADIFRACWATWRGTVALSLGQLKVMSAIEQCRSAALGGHV